MQLARELRSAENAGLSSTGRSYIEYIDMACFLDYAGLNQFDKIGDFLQFVKKSKTY